jgi:MFS family permease
MSDGKAMAAKEYGFLVLLTLLNVMNFVDRQLLSSFANFIVPDLGLSNTQFGLLTGFAFIIFYAVMGLFMGALADLVHRPRLIAIGLALWSALTAASGAARGFGSLAVPRMFIGVGESALTPTSMSLLSDRFPPSRLGFASGFYYMGVPIGIGVSLLIAGYLGPAIGWRGCFYVLGAIGLALAVVMLFVKETPRRHVGAAGAGAKTVPAGAVPTHGHGVRAIVGALIRALRFSPALTLTIAGGVAMHFVLGAAAFDQLWYVKERGFERAEIAQMTGWIGMIAGVIGNLFGGVVGDWWLRRTGTGRAMFLFWLGLVLAPFNIAYRLVPGDSPLFWIGVFAGYFGLGAFYGPTFSTVQELVPPQIRATVVAFYILMLNLIGLGVGITAGGWLIDRLIARGVSEPYSVTLVAFTVLSLSSTPLFFLAGRRFHRDRERLYAAAAAAAPA